MRIYLKLSCQISIHHIYPVVLSISCSIKECYHHIITKHYLPFILSISFSWINFKIIIKLQWYAANNSWQFGNFVRVIHAFLIMRIDAWNTLFTLFCSCIYLYLLINSQSKLRCTSGEENSEINKIWLVLSIQFVLARVFLVLSTLNLRKQRTILGNY